MIVLYPPCAVWMLSLIHICIPARQVYTPRWAHTDDNHAWVEAWADGHWYFFGACEPEPVLNLGWFNSPASRGMLMHTKVFGRYNGCLLYTSDQLLNGAYMSCEMNSWVLSAHLPRQSSKRSLPDFREQIIDLGSGGYGALMAWVHYFFRKPFDKINPVVSLQMRKAIKERILDP